MPFPVFEKSERHPLSDDRLLTKREVSNELDTDDTNPRKLFGAGMLPEPTPISSLRPFLGREYLGVSAGELTVLRTDQRVLSNVRYPRDPRKWIGFHVDHTDMELSESSLRWWRSDPDKVVDNQLFVVTVAEFPVALYMINHLIETMTRDHENRPRHHYSGRLLARVHAGMSTSFAADLPADLLDTATQVMNSRIRVSSGGPIGYLRPTGSRVPSEDSEYE
ncbi:hypothetical protein [Agreia sp. COWG]|uniref:hypothetical protein n=1 Tax=Agreia sp. COWG TaxID=2773266 RepID=UPI001925A293|nr:hypothetical protein [Agreia sp. COWG]CAD6015962.1 protein of unknown function [Agreia sp. COWG]